MFKRLLIANRGEIACRIMRSARRLGIETVAVYSAADANSLPVREADYAVAIGAASAADSYLNADRIVAAAQACGAEAIHPGYGFLSERLELIDACAAAGIVFVGPHRAAVAAMGSKIESKRMARAAGVLCVPGYDGAAQDPATLAAEAGRIGFPLLIKASAGGGGKGMRRVNEPAEFLPLLVLARREALAAFGDDGVLLEKYIAQPRHLEVQLMGDRHGTLLHLFERECSIQRRFQKVIEEAPAQHLPEAIATQLYTAALQVGRAMAYDNAGTVEFVMSGTDDATPYFLEVNTRLQVEHGVTEMCTGIDLVEWQLRAASGEALPLAQHEIRRTGWAIECRVNAEAPEHDYRASLGTVLGYAEPMRLPGVRVDSGIGCGSEITPYYDSLLTKVLGHGASRREAVARLRAGIEQLRIEGVRTNAALLLQILQHPAFDSVLSTNFIEQHFAHGPHAEPWRVCAHRLAVAAAWATARAGTVSRWGSVPSFRLNAGQAGAARIDLRLRDEAAAAEATALRIYAGDGLFVTDELQASVCATDNGYTVRIAQAGRCVTRIHVIRRPDDRWFSWADGRSMGWEIAHELERGQPGQDNAGTQRQLTASLPGRIAELRVVVGQAVTAGEAVLTLEAMKLYHTLPAPLSAKVSRLLVGHGDIVAHGQLLVEFDAPDQSL